VRSSRCADSSLLRIIGDDPSTPLATVEAGEIREAGASCCDPWARKGTLWTAVDAYGSVVGGARVSAPEAHGVSGCAELEFKRQGGPPGVGLYLSGPYMPRRTAEWEPNAKEMKDLAQMVTSLEAAMVPTPSSACSEDAVPVPIQQRALFFMTHGSRGRRSWAVVGGPLLVLARKQDDGRWVARSVDALAADKCSPGAYQPKAAFDIDGDGLPEVFVHFDWGDSFGELLFELDTEGALHQVAESVAGPTA
jgi:hypothetical protein